MLQKILQDTTTAWPASAVGDTVAAITREASYDRSVTRSLWEQLLELFGRALGALFRMLPPLPTGRVLIVTLSVLLVLLVIARIWLNARARREFWAGERRDLRPGRAADAWAESQRLAREGRHLEAAHQLCIALIAASARRGEVTLHPSKTTGDYAREMRRRGVRIEGDFQRFRARYDRVVYDAQACTADEYARLLADARPLLALERAA